MTNNQWHIVLKAPVEGVHTVIYRYPGASPPVAVATVPQSRVFEYEEFLKENSVDIVIPKFYARGDVTVYWKEGCFSFRRVEEARKHDLTGLVEIIHPDDIPVYIHYREDDSIDYYG